MVPERFIVVDGNVYFIELGDLMHAPMTSAGQVAWEDAGVVEALSAERTLDIKLRIETAFGTIEAAHREA
jgi:hypothetical protein